jgi:hypothetical protein
MFIILISLYKYNNIINNFYENKIFYFILIGRKMLSGGTGCSTRLDGGKGKAKKAKKRNVNKGKKSGGGSTCDGAPYPQSIDNAELYSAKPESVPVEAPGQEGGAKKKKKVKKARKAGPYAKFVKKNFASVAKKNPKWKATDCMKEIAKMWRAQKK